MSVEQRIWLTAICVIAVAVICRLFTYLFSADSMRERRRRRSNLRLASKAKRPTVRFSVRTKKGRKRSDDR